MPTATKTPASTKKSSKRSAKKAAFPQLVWRQWLGIGLIIAIITGLIWVIVNQTTTANSGKLNVYASFYPLYEFSQQVGGNLIKATDMTPAGMEPHDYDPSPRQLANAANGQLFIYNNADMEPWATKFAQTFNGTVVVASQNINLRSAQADNDQDASDHDHDHDHGQTDPHIWTDPVLAQTMVANIRDGLIKADPTHASTYKVNAAHYISQLSQLDASFSQGLAQCTTRTVVTSHAAFAYLAQRYNLDIVPIAGLSPDQEPSAGQLAQLKNIVKNYGIRYIFFENKANDRLAATLAKETGVQTAVLNPIESLSQSELSQGQNYITTQEANLAHLRTALSCR